MHVPAALEQWAAEHNEQLSSDTLSEVHTIAETISASSLSERLIDDPGDDFAERLESIFPVARAERAATLVQIVSDWSKKHPPAVAENHPPARAETAGANDGPEPVDPLRELAPDAIDDDEQTDFEPPRSTFPRADTLDDRVEAPPFLHSDKVDEEDDVRLYGPRRPWKAVAGTFFVLAVLGGVAFGGWYWLTQRDDTDDVTADTSTSATPEPAGEPVQAAPTPEPSVPPTAVPEPTPVLPSYWADTMPILNSGSSEIAASTYAVSPANRAVLTGHTAAITGLAVSDDGRVLTSGADRRLVDWGADVTLANPDVLNVPAPLTVLERTVDQRILAGDSDGNVTVIDLVNTVEPIVLPVHDVAISALSELPDGRLAVASAEGAVAVFAVATADERIALEHDVEVTGVVGLADGTIATAAVDGVLRLWSADGSGEPGEIATLGAPITALTVLGDGQLAMASVDGTIHVVPATAGTNQPTELPGHVGAVRSLHELTLADDTVVLASGGDDTTIRLWNVASQNQVRVLEGHGDIVSGIDSLPDGRLVSTSGDGTGRVWDLSVPPGRPVIAPHDWNLSAMHAWNNDQFVTGGADGKVVLASTAETAEPALVTQHDAPILDIAVLENGDVVSLDADSTLRINEPSGASAGLVEITLAAGATTFSVRAGQGIVSGHADGSVRLHDFAEEVAVIDVHGTEVNDVITHSSGVIVSAGQDNTVRIINPDEPDTVPIFDLHTGPVDVVLELPDGRIASAGSDGIYIFTLEGLSQDHVRLNGQRSRTISLVALRGDRLISTGDDGRVRLWNLSTPEAEPTTLIDIPGVVNPYLIQADNGLFVAGAARGYVVFTLS